MAEVGQIWASGERTVRVLETYAQRVVIRDTYGWRRLLTEQELENGFRVVTDHVEPVRGVMGRRALADVEPA
jgi:hypothetical protein